MKSITIDGVEYELTPKNKTEWKHVDGIVYPSVEFIVSEKEMTWYEAVAWCERLGGRLPTMTELHVYRERLCNHLGNLANNYFWSASTRSNSTSNAWIVGLGYGTTNANTKTNSSYVVCVR